MQCLNRRVYEKRESMDRADNSGDFSNTTTSIFCTFKTLPALIPCKRAVPSKEAVANCSESRENAREVIPLAWAGSSFRRHFPLLIFQI